jgi:hypothetical protein
MTHIVTLQIPDEVYQPLVQVAAQAGKTPEQWTLERLRRWVPTPQEREAALARLMRHAGADDLGHATGIDNDSIDADLAREYNGLPKETP